MKKLLSGFGAILTFATAASAASAAVNPKIYCIGYTDANTPAGLVDVQLSAVGTSEFKGENAAYVFQAFADGDQYVAVMSVKDGIKTKSMFKGSETTALPMHYENGRLTLNPSNVMVYSVLADNSFVGIGCGLRP